MKDNYLITLFIAGTLLIVLFAFFLIALLVVQRARRNRAQMEKNAIIASHKQEMLTIHIEVQDEMFNKISRELHDNVGQVLSAANMQLYSLVHNINQKSVPTVVEDTMGLIRSAINDIRDLSHSLNSEHTMRLGLIEVLKKELAYIYDTQRIACELIAQDEELHLSKDEELVIYRITQEALNNIIKHAQATQITIIISATDDEFSIYIKDNGVGFNISDAYTGIGLSNMRQRATMVNASLDITSAISEGSSINLNLKTHGRNNEG